MTIREQCESLYKAAFGEDKVFDAMLFDLYSESIEILQTDGIVAAMYFKIPCTLNLKGDKIPAYYIYAVTTHGDYRHKGLMSQLFADTQTEPDAFYFLKPSSDGVIPFYRQAGFTQIIGTRSVTDAVIEVDDSFKKLSSVCDKPQSDYPVMIKGNYKVKNLTFEFTLE